MAKLFLRNAYEFENPSRRIFRGGELFEGAASQQASKTKEYFKNGESTPEAIALAKAVEDQAEEIRKGTNKELRALYVDLFNSFKIPDRSNLSGPETPVDAKYEKRGILAVAADICPMLGRAYQLYPDLQLLSYATVFNNLKDDKGVKADANKLPIGATVRVDNGIVYVTYLVGKELKTFHSELFPWDSYNEAYAKWLVDQKEEAAAQEAIFQRDGRPDDDLDLDGNTVVPPAPSTITDSPAEVPATSPVEEVAPAIPQAKPEPVEADAPDVPDETIDETALNQLDIEWSVIEPLILSLQKQHTEIQIRAYEPSLRNGQINRTKYSKIIEVTNTKTGAVYRVELNVPVKDRPTSYIDERVKISVERHTPSHDNEDVRLLNAAGEELSYSGENRVYNTVEGVVEAMTRVTELESDNDARDVALKNEWLTQVKPRLQELEALFPGSKITFTDASFTKKENKPADEVDPFPNYGEHGKTISIQYGPKKTDVKRYQILVPKKADSYLDASVVIAKDVQAGLGIKWKDVKRGGMGNIYDYFAGEIDELTKSNVLDGLRVKDIARLNQLPPANQLYYLEWYVSRTLNLAQKNPAERSNAEQKELYEFYSKGVEMEVSEKWYLELSPKLAADLPSTQARLQQVADNIRELQELRKSHPYEGLNKKEVAESERKAAAVVPVELTPRQRFTQAADALSIAYTLTPEQVRDGSTYVLLNANAVAKKLALTYPGYYLQITNTVIQAPAVDGSGKWSATFTTADGYTFEVHVEVPPVDQAAVDTFIEEEAALGKNFAREDVIRYAAYQNMMQAWNEAILNARSENSLDEKYDGHMKKRVPATAPTAPEATPTEIPAEPAARPEESDWSKEVTAALNDEETVQAAPETYKELTDRDINDHFSGKGTWTWMEGGLAISYRGPWTMGVPSGQGELITDDGGVIPLDLNHGRFTVGDTSYQWESEAKRIVKLEF